MKRSRPPAGYLTRAQAEARLQAILAGQDEMIPVKPKPGSEVTFGMAAREWMRYVEHDRKRRPSTVQDYRRELSQRLIPEFGSETPLTEITTARIEEFRERMVAEGRVSARTINKRLQQLHALADLLIAAKTALRGLWATAFYSLSWLRASRRDPPSSCPRCWC